MTMDEAPRDGLFSVTHPGCYSQGPTRNLLIWLALNLVSLTLAFEATCLCVTLPAIAQDLDASLAASLALGSSFLLAMALVQPLAGEVSHLAGRRPVMLTAVGIFAAGTIVCGLARSPGVLLAGRCIQGAGAGATEPVKALVFYDIYRPRQRAAWLALSNVSWAVGTVSGPLLGGFFASSDATWRWAFWINLFPLALSFVATAVLLGYDSPPALRWTDVASVDWPGITLFVVSGTLVLVPLTCAGSQLPWSSCAVIVALVSGAVGLAVLGVHERRWASQPLFRPSVFRSPSTALSCVAVTLHGLAMWILLFYLSLYYLGVRGLDPLAAGVWGLPATLTVAPMAGLVGCVVARTGHYRSFLLLGWSLSGLAFGLLHLAGAHSPPGLLVPVTLVIGVGFGVLVPGLNVAVQANVDDPGDAGRAACMASLLRPAGSCLGITVGLAVFASRLKAHVVEQGLSPDLTADLLRHMRMGGESGNGSPRLSGDMPVLVECVVKALHDVWTAGVATAGLGLILTLFTKTPGIAKDEREDGQDGQDEPGPVDDRAKPSFMMGLKMMALTTSRSRS